MSSHHNLTKIRFYQVNQELIICGIDEVDH